MENIKIITPFHTDDRGTLAYLSDQKIKIRDVLVLDSKKGAIRANHYHKEDIHYMYIVSGSFEYITKNMSEENPKIERAIVKAGEMVITPPMFAHKVIFLEDTLAIVLTTEPRDQEHYEKDTIRLEVDE